MTCTVVATTTELLHVAATTASATDVAVAMIWY